MKSDMRKERGGERDKLFYSNLKTYLKRKTIVVYIYVSEQCLSSREKGRREEMEYMFINLRVMLSCSSKYLMMIKILLQSILKIKK